MLIYLHKQATTEQTIYKSGYRYSLLDRSHTAHRLQTTLTPHLCRSGQRPGAVCCRHVEAKQDGCAQLGDRLQLCLRPVQIALACEIDGS
jgi:hypothetical protein